MVQRRQARRFAQVRDDLGCNLSQDGLLVALTTPDAHVANTAFTGLELADVAADGTVFENVVFRSCTFTDVLFSGCRFVRCDLGRSWLNRVDFRSCSAPGLSFLKGRLTGVSLVDSQLAYADLSETTVDQLVASETKLSEASFHATKLRHLALDRCDLSRATFFRTSLSGVDLSSCDISGLRVSSDLRELRGAVIDPDQAAELMGLLGIKIKEEAWL